jgi:polypyrimidine tract-binding protein 2
LEVFGVCVFGCFSRGAGEMTSMAGQPQFRYTQQPSKVLHVRNLPWECSEEELIELCKPFGKVVNTKVNVGANQNQAFIEFADLNQAIAMVSYYASSSEPAQVRGKTVYVQYSNRQEIVNSKNSGDVVSNVLLVTIEGVEAGDVSIDVLHLVFSAFGFVHKIATFEKSAGFQVCSIVRVTWLLTLIGCILYYILCHSSRIASILSVGYCHSVP